jgi:hypothetical protein
MKTLFNSGLGPTESMSRTIVSEGHTKSILVVKHRQDVVSPLRAWDRVLVLVLAVESSNYAGS